jgi:hypothetical protein
VLGAVAELAALDGDAREAARLLGGSEAVFAEIGMRVPTDEVREQERTRAQLGELLGEETVDALVDEGRAASEEAMIAKALAATR